MPYSKKKMTTTKKAAVKKATVKKAETAYKKAKKTSKLGAGKRFAAMTSLLKAKGAKSPKALAAWIGRRKYGAKKMASMATAGRKRAK